MGQFAGLPADAPIVYRAMTALFVLLFARRLRLAGLATDHQPAVRRVRRHRQGRGLRHRRRAVADGAVPGSGVLAIVGDILLALVFAWCLLDRRR